MFDSKQHPTLIYSLKWSSDILQQMQQRLSSLAAGAETDIFVVAVSGSLGRLDGLPHSDCDLIVLVKDEIIDDPVRGQSAMQLIWRTLQPMQLRLPKSTGIYATPSSPSQICDHTSLGLIADDKNIFGKRMQILLDTQPVYMADNFYALIDDLLLRYASGFLIYDQKKEWLYLLNDLIRYFRSYCAWHQFDLSNDAIDSWHMRNAKLSSSRLLMFAGLLLLLGECSKEKQDKIAWLRRHIPLTPMQRIEQVYAYNNDDHFNILLAAYEAFMQRMHSPEFRASLVNATPSSLEELRDTHIVEYEDLCTHTDQIIKELTRFVLARRDDWSTEFFQYLLF